jgi:hypothetical protein
MLAIGAKSADLHGRSRHCAGIGEERLIEKIDRKSQLDGFACHAERSVETAQSDEML